MKIIKAIHLTVEKGGVKEENSSPEAVKDPTDAKSSRVVETEGGVEFHDHFFYYVEKIGRLKIDVVNSRDCVLMGK
jgi:hypothetical protein